MENFQDRVWIWSRKKKNMDPDVLDPDPETL